MYQIDLNCDCGESFGAYTIGNDEAVMPLITSANIACGFHAGDPTVMRKTVQLALQHGVAIGAHPGLADLQGFGRRAMTVTPAEVYDLVIYQIGALQAIVHAEGGQLHHVKPHGALYNMAAQQPALADAIAQAVYRVNPTLKLYGLANSELTKAAERSHLVAIHEVFADRNYEQDGTLTPRQYDDAVIVDSQYAAQRVVQMVKTGTVVTRQQTLLPLRADTVCIHGDSPHAASLVQQLRDACVQENIRIGKSGSGQP